ncbi:protein XRP2-like [Anneissia japonica]|uniref:protein XRP2-like n=1 Tax=Anneissia japonica TaxID=1529436 RepID=UPI001425B4AA|nr:protein XRP2-like [Anneissia japonica]
MGCLFSKPNVEGKEEQNEQEFSWDKRKSVDPNDFIIDKRNGETIVKLPGTVDGQQFMIMNCESSNIYIFNHLNTITVDKCTNCKIFLGPVKGSVFLRNCENCQCVIACQQFRTRDCKKVDTFLHCETQPIIESSTRMRFGCFQYYYEQLAAQFRGAGISPFNTNWSNIHDFTPVPEEQNWSLLPQDAKVMDYVPIPAVEDVKSMDISMDHAKSTVPISTGSQNKTGTEECLVAFFRCDDIDATVLQFLDEARQEPSFDLIQTKEVTIQPSEVATLFGQNPKYEDACKKGQVIGVEFCGENTVQNVRKLAESYSNKAVIFVSSNTENSSTDVENFFNFADIQMSV